MSGALTIDSLQKILGRDVEEIHLTIAKSSALGLDVDSIAATLGIQKTEIEALMEEQDYKDIRLLVGAEQAKDRVERDFGWDGIENGAVRKLARRVEMENDTDTLLRIAAVANRAVRRAAPPKESVLDPSQAGVRIPLTLTQRYTEKLNSGGQVVERSKTQQISVLNGSAINPSFSEVKSLLHGEVIPVVKAPQTSLANIEQTADVEDFSFESIREMAKGIQLNG
jgi:hypothetical protein